MPAKKTTKKTAAKKAAKAPEQAPPLKPAKKAAAKKAPAKKAAKKATKHEANEAKPARKSAPSIDVIARSAYLNYRRRVENGLPGDSQGDWWEAERQLRES